MALSRVSAILFDLDGTLLDFQTAERIALKNVYTKLDLPWTETCYEAFRKIDRHLRHELRHTRSRNETVPWLRFFHLLTPDFQSDQPRNVSETTSRLAQQIFLTGLLDYATPMPGAVEAVQQLAKSYPVGVVSNGSAALQEQRMERAGFEVVWTTKVFSSEAGCSKPQPKIFAIARKGLMPINTKEILFVGDNFRADILGAHRFGMQTCWINPSLPKNLLNSAPQASNEAKSPPDLHIHSLAELDDILR